MLVKTFGYLEPYVAATRPGRLVLVRRFLVALDRALRNEAERDGACIVAGNVFGLPSAVLQAASIRGAEGLDDFLSRALAGRIDAAPEGVDARADWLVRWGPLVEALVPEGPHGASPVPDMVTLSPDFAALFARLPELARSHLPLMLEGQPGTGRESLARAIHAAGRAPRPFIAFDVRAIPDADVDRVLFGSPLAPGLLSRCGEGSLLLRNAESIPIATQHRLARSIEFGAIVELDGRVREPLRGRLIFIVGDGALSAAGPGLGVLDPDFAYRAATLYARLPALSERGEDLAALYRNIVRRFVLKRDAPLSSDEVLSEPRMNLTPRALLALYSYRWPGNVAEFVSIVREARGRAGMGPLELSHLPERIVAALGRGGDLPEDHLRSTLLGVAPATIDEKRSAQARDDLRVWRDAELERRLNPDVVELIGRSVSAYNALRRGQNEPLTSDRVLPQIRAACAREILLPAGSNLPLFWDERAELISELEAQAAGQAIPGAVARRLFDLGRTLVLFPDQARAQLQPSWQGGEQRASSLAHSLVQAAYYA